MPSSFSLTELVLAVVVLASAVYVGTVLLSYLLPVFQEVGQNIVHGFRNPLVVNSVMAAARQRRRHLRNEIDQELGRDGQWHDPEADMVRAAHHTQTLTALDHKLRESVRACFHLHWR